MGERQNIKIDIPQPKDIYCEPYINYGWDEGAQKYLSQIAVTHSSAAVYDTSYVTGITNPTDAQNLWNACH